MILLTTSRLSSKVRYFSVPGTEKNKAGAESRFSKTALLITGVLPQDFLIILFKSDAERIVSIFYIIIYFVIKVNIS